MTLWRYYWGSLLFTAVSLALAAWLGWSLTGTLLGVLGTLWICAVLGVLEVSLSFDNAVVNASVLKTMSPFWRKAFLTWGILIAVFGMRILFPLVIVAVAANLGPVEAVRLAIAQPAEYERIIKDAHVGIAGFGGAFLALVGLNFFLDSDKTVHWIAAVESRLAKLADVNAIAVGVVVLALLGVSAVLPAAEVATFLVAGLWGVIAFLAVHSLAQVLGTPDEALGATARSGAASFLYLELLDASFSFDGVIGAFALSSNLFIIALGLGIGAMFVRSMTVMLVEKETLQQYRYLEHGAFWAILALAAIMLLSARWHIPETITGLIGAVLIGLSFWASLRFNKQHPEAAEPAALPDGGRLDESPAVPAVAKAER